MPKSEYGKFYMEDSYIVLQTSQGKGGAYFYDLHFWIGKDTSQDEAGTTAIKAVELDIALGGRAVQQRDSRTRVPFARSSLNHDDVFILDTDSKIYQFNGANSNIQERARALEIIQFLKEKYHEGKCDVAIVDDGKLDTESDSGSAGPVTDEKKGKVTALLKQQGIGVKGMTKSTPVNEENPYLLEEGGKMEVWRINESAKTSLLKDDIGKFHSGDCYIVLYTYHSGERKEDYFLCCWFGKDSIEEDQTLALKLANTMSNSLKGRPVQGRIFEGKKSP
ncbi:hypothetical protein KIW84_033063 [Lathyrus oleraceus]|uniref:Gelsolin-like domain-containing protein n=1 Tax=Pisum sativum TaxID=3888 RepID=A0A9D4XUS9_PEA|nr:hypothetical protein KIW84_033063 [Pisum sativum]